MDGEMTISSVRLFHLSITSCDKANNLSSNAAYILNAAIKLLAFRLKGSTVGLTGERHEPTFRSGHVIKVTSQPTVYTYFAMTKTNERK